MIKVQLPDGRRISVNTTDPQAAARAAKVYLQQEADRQQYNPADVSTMENIMAGAGKSVVDTGRGIKQLAYEAGNLVGLVPDKTVADMRAAQDAVNQQDAPLMSTKAGVGGYVGGLAATTVVPGAIAARGAQAANMTKTAAALKAFTNPATYRAAAASGAIQGATRPVGTDESRTANTALGAVAGVAGNAIVNSVGRVVQPIKKALKPAQAWAVRELERAGVPMDLSQVTGSVFAQRVRRALKDNPVTAEAQGAFVDTQRSAYNKAVLKTIGENADSALPNIMDSADTRIGGVMDSFAAKHGVNYDQPLENDFVRILGQARNELEQPQYSVVRSQIYEALDKAAINGGKIPGEAYQNIRTAIGRISVGPDQAKGHWVRQIREALDDGLERSVPKSEVEVLKHARQQYRRLKQIEGAVDESGNISPAKLFNVINRKANRSQSQYGRGDQALVKLARAGKIILQDKMADSGTPAGLAAQAALPLGVGLATQAVTGDPEKAFKAGLLAYAVPKGAQYLMNNPSAVNYLAGGLPSGAMRNALSVPGSQPLVGAGLKALPPAIAYGVQK